MADIEFVDGLLIKAPHEKAPDFVKAQIGIKVDALIAWLESKRDTAQRGKDGNLYINLDVKVSQKGNWYAAVNAYQPKEKKEDPLPTGKGTAGKMAHPDEDIPF